MAQAADAGVVVVDRSGVTRMQVVLALLAVYLIWGSTYYCIVVALKGFPPLLMAGTRHLTAGLMMDAFMRAKGVPRPTWRQWANCLLLGILFQGLGNGLVVVGSRWVDSSLAAVLVASMPLWAAILGGFWGTWPTRREAGALILGTVGVVVLNLGRPAGGELFGVLLVLVAAASWGLGTVWSRHLALPAGGMTAAAQMIAAGAVLTIAGLVGGETIASPSWDAWAAWWYLTIFGSLVGYTAFQFLLANVSRPLATSYAYVNPLVAMLIGVGFAGEPLTTQRVLGTACILLGVMRLLVRR